MPFERNKEFFSVKNKMTVELLRRDADHDMRDAIQRQRLPDDVRIGAQLVLPEAVSQNHDGFSRQGSSITASNPGPRASATPIV